MAELAEGLGDQATASLPDARNGPTAWRSSCMRASPIRPPPILTIRARPGRPGPRAAGLEMSCMRALRMRQIADSGSAGRALRDPVGQVELEDQRGRLPLP